MKGGERFIQGGRLGGWNLGAPHCLSRFLLMAKALDGIDKQGGPDEGVSYQLIGWKALPVNPDTDGKLKTWGEVLENADHGKGDLPGGGGEHEKRDRGYGPTEYEQDGGSKARMYERTYVKLLEVE